MSSPAVPASSKIGSALTFVNTAISDVLSRPVAVKTGTWSTASTANTNLYSASIASLLTGNTMWSRKIDGFNLVRGTAVFRIQLNANPFQQGRLLFHLLPCQTHMADPWTAAHNAGLTQKTQHPNVEIDCNDSSGVIKIPYVTPSSWYDVNQAIYDWGTVYLDVLSPLNTGSGGETNVEYTVFLHFENFELDAPYAPQSTSNAKRNYSVKRVGRGEAYDMNSGPISGALSKMSTVTNILGEIPIISNLMQPVSWLTDIFSRTAGVWGYSKANIESPPMYVTNRQLPYMASSEGVNPAASLALIARNALQATDSIGGTKEDEMSINYLKKVPAYISNFLIQDTDTVDTVEYNTNVSPLDFTSTQTLINGGHAYTYKSMPAFAYLAYNAAYYRGSICLTFKFIKTQYHTGRVMFVWTPFKSPAVTQTTVNSSYAYREIVDFSTSSEVTLCLPYIRGEQYSQTIESYGNLQVILLNELRHPETAASSIQVLVYAHAGDDYEVQFPSFSTAGNLPSRPFVAQMDVNSETKLVEKPIGTATIQNFDPTHSSLAIGEHWMSIKQVLLRPSGFSCPGNTLGGLFSIVPWFIGATQSQNGTFPTTGPAFDDAYSLYASGYCFSRGGFRITATVWDNSQDHGLYQTQLVYLPSSTHNFVNPTIASGLTYVTRTPGYDASSLNHSASLPTQIFNNNANIADVVIPYYGPFRCRLNQIQSVTSTSFPQDKTQPRVAAVFSTGNQSSTDGVSTFRAVTDDHQLAYFIGFMPTLLVVT